MINPLTIGIIHTKSNNGNRNKQPKHPTIGTEHITQKLSKKPLEALTQKSNIMHIQQGGAASVKYRYLARVFLDQINLRSKHKLTIYEQPIPTPKPPQEE